MVPPLASGPGSRLKKSLWTAADAALPEKRRVAANAFRTWKRGWRNETSGGSHDLAYATTTAKKKTPVYYDQGLQQLLAPDQELALQSMASSCDPTLQGFRVALAWLARTLRPAYPEGHPHPQKTCQWAGEPGELRRLRRKPYRKVAFISRNSRG